MSETIHIQATVEHDGEVHLLNLPLKRGQRVELSIRLTQTARIHDGMTAGKLLDSDIIGIWHDRTDIGDNLAFARDLREQAQHRQR